MKKKTLFALFIILCVCGSCSNSVILGLEGNADTLNIDKCRLQDEILFSSVFGKPKTIFLEKNPTCVIQNVYSMDILGDKIFILDDKSQALYVFDSHGKYLGHVGEKGNGHGEYIELSDFSVDRENKYLYLWDWGKSSALKYDLNTFKFVSSVKVKEEGAYSFGFQFLNGDFYLNRTSNSTDEQNYELRRIDGKTGTQIDSYLSSKDYNEGFNMPLGLANSLFYSKNTKSPKYVGMFSNTIVSLSDKNVTPKYVIESKEFMNESDIQTFFKQSKEGISTNSDEMVKQNKYFAISGISEFSNYISFHLFKGLDRRYVLFNRKTRKLEFARTFVNDYLSDTFIPMEICYSDKKGVVAYISPDLLPAFRQAICSNGLLKKNIDGYERLKNMEAGSNPVLFFFPIKYE